MSTAEPRAAGVELELTWVALIATLLVLPVIGMAGHVAEWMLPCVFVAALLVFGRRDSPLALVILGILAFLWIFGRPDALTPWCLVMALLLFIIHTSLAMQTTAPPDAAFGADVIRRWLGRSAVVAALTGVVYLGAAALEDLRRGDTGIALAAAFALLAGLGLLLRRETLAGAADPPHEFGP